MRRTRKLLRREFMKTTGAGVAALGAAPSVLASLGSAEKLAFAVIGCRRGMDHIRDLVEKRGDPAVNVEIAAVCDIYRPRLEAASRASGAKGYSSYKEILDRKDIDCIVVATPDHWHLRMCLDSLAAGKDVYCEKPWTRTWEEAKECYHAVLKSKRILQVGTQHTAEGQYWAAREAIQSGKLGKLVWSQTSYSRNSMEGEWNYDIDVTSSPENLDWEAFLGSAPKKPFNREHFFRFRKYWDYSGGIATDLHYHKLAPILIAVGADFPWRVTSGGGIWVHKDVGHQSPREVPDTFMTLIDMPAEHTIVLASSMANSSGLPEYIRGHEANLSFHGVHVEVRPESIYADRFKKAQDGADSIRIPAMPREPHMLNFIHCVRSRKLEDLNCGPELGYQTMVAISMSVQTYRENKVLFWDKQKEEVTDKDPKKVA